MPGCARYDCLGAGQLVTQQILPGRFWRDGPTIARVMFDAFRRARRVLEIRLALHSLPAMGLATSLEPERRALLSELEPETWTHARLLLLDLGLLERRVRALSLAPESTERPRADRTLLGP